MKTVILAGGYGTRIAEESRLCPKPMIEIGGWPLLWHIMKIYSSYGFNDFIICAGHGQHVIKEFFANYALRCSDITFDFTQHSDVVVHHRSLEPWKVTIADTGSGTTTGGRILRVRDYIGDNPFFLTYGDGVSDVNISSLLNYHREKKKIATITVVQEIQHFGAVKLDENHIITQFREKSSLDNRVINGGFMVLEPEVFKYIKEDVPLERGPMESLAADGQLAAFQHRGFWQCMDTLRDKLLLEKLWNSGDALWKVW